MGYVGAVVAGNIARLREEKNLSRPDLARRIGMLHQTQVHGDWELSPSKINALAITRIETGERRVDVDDLVLFAVALGVAVPTLLMPPGDGVQPVLAPIEPVRGEYYWEWLTARRPLSNLYFTKDITPDVRRKARQFFLDSIPAWSDDFEKIPTGTTRDGDGLRLLLDSPTYATDDDDPHGGNVQ